MSIRIRRYKRGGWEADIRVLLPDGRELRERRRAPVSSKSSATRWAQERERYLFLNPPSVEKEGKEVPTLSEFAPRFIADYAVADRQKPSGIATKRSILRLHLLPHLGRKRLDEIRNRDVQSLKAKLGRYRPKTVNNILSVLNRLLRTAVDWEELDEMPCTIRLLRVESPEMAFLDFAEYSRLVEGAVQVDRRAMASVLLAGDAGLRRGEILALQWHDLDLKQGLLYVRHSDWRGQLTTPKSGRPRKIPMTKRLRACLQALRHLRGNRVLCFEDGRPLTHNALQDLVRRAARFAQVRHEGIHVLRHTFCSHLAMKGAPARAIQELAGHADLSTTQRYMHLSPRAVKDAIRLLEESPQSFGDI